MISLQLNSKEVCSIVNGVICDFSYKKYQYYFSTYLQLVRCMVVIFKYDIVVINPHLQADLHVPTGCYCRVMMVNVKVVILVNKIHARKLVCNFL